MRAAVAAIALLLTVGALHGAAATDPVARCVADNLVRYDTPDRAVVAQYVDIVAACRAAVAGDPVADVSLSPIGGAAADGFGPPSAPSAAPSAAASGGAASPDGPATRSPDASAGPGAPAGGPAPGSAVSPRVQAALASGPERGGLPLTGGGVPPWLLVIAGLGAAGVAAAAVHRAWSRRR